MVQSWWITQAADYVSSFSSNSCICHCLIRDQKHTLHGAGVPIAPAVMRKWEAFSFHFYGFSTLRGHSPTGGNSDVFIELGAWHLLGLFWGGRGRRNRAILGNCFAGCLCDQGMMERWGNDGEMRKWWSYSHQTRLRMEYYQSRHCAILKYLLPMKGKVKGEQVLLTCPSPSLLAEGARGRWHFWESTWAVLAAGEKEKNAGTFHRGISS